MSESNLTARQPLRVPYHVIQATTIVGLAMVPFLYVAATVGFEPATLRTKDAELTTEPSRPTNTPTPAHFPAHFSPSANPLYPTILRFNTSSHYLFQVLQPIHISITAPCLWNGLPPELHTFIFLSHHRKITHHHLLLVPLSITHSKWKHHLFNYSFLTHSRPRRRLNN